MSIENLNLTQSVESFEVQWIHIEEIGQKFERISLEETKDWCHTLNGIFSKHFEEKWIDFTSAFNSLSNKIG